MCVCVCVFVRVFLSHYESHWDALWHKVAFWSRKGYKTTIVWKTQNNVETLHEKLHFQPCLFNIPAISKLIWMPFGMKLHIGPAKVVKHQYLGKRKKCGNAAWKTSF